MKLPTGVGDPATAQSPEKRAAKETQAKDSVEELVDREAHLKMAHRRKNVNNKEAHVNRPTC
jgi:hypothetical protein